MWFIAVLTRYVKFDFFDKYAFIIYFLNQKWFYLFFKNSFKATSTHIVSKKKNTVPNNTQLEGW